MRILFVTKRYYTNQDLIGGRFGRLFHLPVALADLGHEVSVVALDYRGRRSEVHEIEDVTFGSVPLRGVQSLSLWRRVKSIADEFGPDVVIGTADTHLGWIARRLARRSGSRFVFDLYDNYLSFASARIPGMKRLFDRVIKSADLVVAVSDALLDVAKRYRSPAVKIVNGVDRDLFHPMLRDGARRQLGLDSGLVIVGYIGSIEPGRGMETLLEAAERLRDDHLPTVLVAGADRLGIDGMSADVDYRGAVDQDQVPQMIAACDVVVLPYLSTEWGRYTYPNKLAEYVACGVPIVATDLPEFVATLGADHPGLCPPGDGSAMARAIERQVEHPVVVDTDLARSWRELAAEMEQAFKSLDL